MVSKTQSQIPRWVFNIADETQGLHLKLRDGVTTRIFTGNNLMLSVVHFAPNTPSIMHSHPEEQWGVLLKGECVRIQENQEIEMKVGNFWYTPAGVSHGIRTGNVGATILDIFSPPREEYKRAEQDD